MAQINNQDDGHFPLFCLHNIKATFSLEKSLNTLPLNRVASRLTYSRLAVLVRFAKPRHPEKAGLLH